jgi:peptide/nickel transport system permease protein
MRAVLYLAKGMVRTLALVLMVMAGSTILVRLAPGYLSDAREMDAHYGDQVRVELSKEAARSGSPLKMLKAEMVGWIKGNAGISRQFDTPVSELIRPRLAVTGVLLLKSMALAWALAWAAALISSAGRSRRLLWQAPATLLLAIPTAAMATLCLLTGEGGPVLVMALLLAARDFKFLDRILRRTWLEPQVMHARAQGITTWRLLAAHILPAIVPELCALAGLSIVAALSALVPVEVIFSVPGLGQLAWNAALNRDLPVLLSITLLMALAVTCSGMVLGRRAEWERA